MLFLGFPSGRIPAISNSIVAVNPITQRPVVLSLRHIIYTFFGLDLTEQGWSFPLPPGVSDEFTEWMNVGVQSLFWSTDSKGKINRLNSSIVFPGGKNICFGSVCPLRCSTLSITLAITPAVPTPKFRVLGRCVIIAGNAQTFDRVFPRKTGTCDGPVVIRSMSIVFGKDSGLLGLFTTRQANVTVLFNRNMSFSSVKNAYSLECMARTLNTTARGPVFNRDSGRVSIITFGEQGSDNPWLEDQEDYSNTMITATFDNFGNRRFFLCRVCVRKSSQTSFCSDWYNDMQYMNHNVDTLDRSGEKYTNTTVIKSKLTTSVFRTTVVNFNPVVVTLYNGTEAAVNLEVNRFSYSRDGSSVDVKNALLDCGDGKRRAVSSFPQVSASPLTIKLSYSEPGFYDVYFQDNFVVEILVFQPDVSVEGPVITFTGSLLPQPLYRSLIDDFRPTAASVMALNSHSCSSLAYTGRNNNKDARIRRDGAIVCDTSMRVAAAERGNMTLRLNMPCTSKLIPLSCNSKILRSSSVDGYVVMNVWLFKLFDRTITPISTLRACRASAKITQPLRQTPGLVYDKLSSSKRASIFSRSKSSWCNNKEYTKVIKEVHDQFVSSVLSRKMAERGGESSRAVLDAWRHCFTSCHSSRRNDVWDLKMASCLELLHNSPFTVGGEKVANNTAQVMSRDSKYAKLVCPAVSISYLEADSRKRKPRSTSPAKPGTGTTTCIKSTEIYQILVSNFDRIYYPVAKQPTNESLFPGNRNPSPIFLLLQSLYCMHVTGEVTVWATHDEFGKLTNTHSSLKPLLLYNRNVTMVRIMVETPQVGGIISKILPSALIKLVTEPKPCKYYIDKIEKALLSWKVVACPDISRAPMKPQNKGEIAPYVVHVIDENYNGWGKKDVQTDILETCSI